ncbi:DUF4111 domain-containing protein [Humibacter sp. BT305]|nr:DUF4111 domain-containing protein [Humibacter sp. BT305]
MIQLAALRRSLDEQLGETEGRSLLGVLVALREGAQAALGADLVGVYLTGSFALGWGDLASDVDVLVVSAQALSPEQEQAARTLHAALPLRHEGWARRLEGSWTTSAALRDRVGAHPWLYVDRGSRTMERSRHDDTWNARWVLRDSGVAVVGARADTLVPAVAASDLRREAVEQAEAKSAWILDDPDVLDDGWAQPYAVLTLCRLLWTAATGTVTGKVEAAEWARSLIVPARFRPLLSASIGYRLHPFDPISGAADPVLVPIAEDFALWARGEVRRRAG